MMRNESIEYQYWCMYFVSRLSRLLQILQPSLFNCRLLSSSSVITAIHHQHNLLSLKFLISANTGLLLSTELAFSYKIVILRFHWLRWLHWLHCLRSLDLYTLVTSWVENWYSTLNYCTQIAGNFRCLTVLHMWHRISEPVAMTLNHIMNNQSIPHVLLYDSESPNTIMALIWAPNTAFRENAVEVRLLCHA